MIFVGIFRNNNKRIWGFTVNDHGESAVCAAVSLLTINTVNSIEAFTDEAIECDYNTDGGFLSFSLPEVRDGAKSGKADILLEAMVLGLSSVKENYADEIEIKDDFYD